MRDTYISFYLGSGRVHVLRETLRGIGNPAFVRFLLSEDGRHMVMTPYNRKVFASMRVPKGVYTSSNPNIRLEFPCMPFCRLMAHHLNWESGQSYRIEGKIYPGQKLVKFDLQRTHPIKGQTEEVQ